MWVFIIISSFDYVGGNMIKLYNMYARADLALVILDAKPAALFWLNYHNTYVSIIIEISKPVIRVSIYSFIFISQAGYGRTIWQASSALLLQWILMMVLCHSWVVCCSAHAICWGTLVIILVSFCIRLHLQLSLIWIVYQFWILKVGFVNWILSFEN